VVSELLTTGAAEARAAFPDWRFAPNIGAHPHVYETENRAIDRAGHLLDAMRRLAPWEAKTIVDLGCGTGYWLPRYAERARRVIGVEPDPRLRAAAVRRARSLATAEVMAGSAEHLPLPANAADVVHARFAYFFAPGCDAGLAEVLRVLRPGGTLVAVDNDLHCGDLGELLGAAATRSPREISAAADQWWRARGATRLQVRTQLRFARRADLEAVLRIEVPDRVSAGWLAANPGTTSVSCGYLLYALTA
jgi:SAM-dependent methyltransferase